jgi:alginate O-acetyltransferase complex protein AlgI
VFFRAPSVSGAFDVLGQLLSGGGRGYVGILVIVTVVLSIASQFVPPRIPENVEVWFGRLAPVLQIGALAAGLVLVDALGPEGIAPFIYFQF